MPYMAFAPDCLTSVGGYPGDEQKGVACSHGGGKKNQDSCRFHWLQRGPYNRSNGCGRFSFGGGGHQLLSAGQRPNGRRFDVDMPVSPTCRRSPHR